MRSQALCVHGLIVWFALAAGPAVWAQERTIRAEKSVGTGGDAVQVIEERDAADFVDRQPEAGVKLFPLEPGTVFQRHVIGGDGSGVTAGSGEKLIYSNTFGAYVASIPQDFRVADDLVTSTVPGPLGLAPACILRRMEFPVLGKIDSGGLGGEYTVSYELFTNCPGAVFNLGPIRVAGTAGQAVFPDDAPRLVSVDFGPNGVEIPNTVWLALSFSRDNAGVVMGAPPQQGSSCDRWDYPGAGSECNSRLGTGGFPQSPYTAMNVELFGDSTCDDAHVVYQANRPSGSPYTAGAARFVTDDITLNTGGCQMVSYEVMVKGTGNYSFELRPTCDAGPIIGTERTASNGGTEPNILRFLFDPPVSIPSGFYFAAKVDNAFSGVVLAGVDPCVGDSLSTIELPEDQGGCFIPLLGGGTYGAMNLTITCAGAAPLGACCDMIFTDENDEAVCRQVPALNCPYPPRSNRFQRPAFVPGAACDPDPFTPQDCGKAACCKPNDECENLTFNECNAVLPLDRPRVWQTGVYCNDIGQVCPINACLARHGDCKTPRSCPASCHNTCAPGCPPECLECPPIGCDDDVCCTVVCGFDFICCSVVWDSDCVDIANEQCTQQPANDVCAPQGRLEGARLLAIPDSQSSDSVHATADPTDPGFGCYLNFPGAPAADTLWYKFRAPPPVGGATRSIITLGTCASNTAARDSLLQVFAVGDPTNAVTQCSSLISNACNDDFSSCGIGNHNSRLCVRDLVPGDWYYVMVGSKVEETDVLARYRLDISQVSSCNTIQFPDELNDNCPRAAVISDGTTPFDLASPANAQATMTAPLDTCIPNMINDRWYDYTATCSGKLTVQTCGTNAATSPATNLAVYDGLACPVATSPRAAIQCSSDLVDACGFGVGEGSKIVIDAVFGSQYNIRLADSQGNRPSGNLNIACVQSDCPAGEITVASPPEGLVDARRPHSPTSAAVLQTTQTVTVATTRDAQPSCFTACETAVSGSPNVIDSVVQNPLGVYTVTFHRPITPGAKTTVIYTDVNAAPSYAHVVSHPGNVRGDATASFDDVLALRDALIGTYFLPWGVFSGDLNRSETQNFEGVTPADLLEAVDLLNGAGAYDPPANGTPNPANDPACP